MAYFDFIKQTRTPKEKLHDAVKENNTDELQQLLDEGIDPNTALRKYGDNTPIQLAAILGYYRCVEVLIKAGGNCDQLNAFEISPLFNAARRDHVLTMKMILKHSRACCGLDTLWYDGRWREYLHNSASDSVLSCLILATPDLNQMRENLTSNILCRCFQRNYFQSIFAFFAGGYNVDLPTYREKVKKSMEKNINANLTNEKSENKLLLKIDSLVNSKNPLPLQAICRLAVRRTFYKNCNVFYGMEKVVLPSSLKEFIVFNGELIIDS
ncbi:uncharacterized protein LOC128203371 [Mya arenaria]|uniref:uncharacterized protein LOC128203371 n=1 Tax=Mya arenaria TaxID=6604 RepID=UPI0022E42A5C|nr:uncharacterized protein LOC128203371 [Mya arenaria]XP_052760743.1 uncharacterized protein LOC128203371 [Mya arenaria]